MLVLRVVGLLLLLGIAGSILLWLLTGNRRYRQWAWKIFRAGLVVLFVFLSLFALERLLAPMI
ncbi:MAG: hypothetical protein C0607_13185 [Azoarcus sp.]|uniref:Uncharacterized protein n=1 Tax=Parazoarcus communis TaxID=41977 RepID=A0A2U8GTD5_9RHOO|nr:hypothetical protein [Parazoarcus communis]AWI76967.1 hypothetical protein CEW83_18455 [Parazoarcus communis]PLX73574.1 MAG: hypothetical protein C0607_13185 [Azoarcus sp.]TVT60626.1 MAG: hypothetical protein FHK80_01145 [Azoarcus sp. PHD]|tara:strand:- start:11167 stop:11355 length:189 start_codon:yes stop_codon:yes gene_type:complete